MSMFQLKPPNVECAVCATAIIRPPKGVRGLFYVSASSEQHTEAARTVGVAPLVGAAERLFRLVDLAGFEQKQAKVVGTLRIAALVGSTERSSCANEIAALAEQHAEVVGRGGHPALVRSLKRDLGTDQVAAVPKDDTEVVGRFRNLVLSSSVGHLRLIEITPLLVQSAEAKRELSDLAHVPASARHTRMRFDLKGRVLKGNSKPFTAPELPTA